MVRRWTDEEVQFLKFAYPNKDFTTKDICLALERGERSICLKARKLGLKRYRENLPSNLKRCSRCKTVYDLQFFSKQGKRGHHSWCKSCFGEYEREKRLEKSTLEKSALEKSALEKSALENSITEKYCPKCKEVKNISFFNKNKARKDGFEQYCAKCFKIIKQENRIKKLKERGW